jgi:molybdate transport system substrate-binding protein
VYCFTRRYGWLLPVLGLLAVLGGCQKPEARLLFHAGAGVRAALDDLVARFHEQNPGVRVDLSYKGSGYFIADVKASQTGDLYMPGEEPYLLQAVDAGYVTKYDPKRDIAAYFVTVIITPRGNPKGVTRVADFARPGLRIGLGDPEACAIGIWHEKIFKKAGIWEQVRQNATLSAKCIPELGNATQLGAIDATIVWASTAVVYLRDVEIYPGEPEYRGIVRLPIASLKFSKHPKLANELKKFILSDEAKKVFHSHALLTEPGPADADGFCADGGQATDQDLRYLVEAARVAKDPSLPVNEETCGHLVAEVRRQRAAVGGPKP